jgi:Domain of unknown function (DUF4203)
MTNESFFALAIAGMIALLFGFVLLFGGYRFFIFLLPIWGFFFGFGLGAQSVQALFGDAFLSTVTSWVVGFVLAVVFAVLSYLFYFAAVAVVAGGLGYALGVGVMEAIGVNFGLIVWLVGVVVAVVLAVAVLALNVQKWVIIIATALLGAEVIVGTFLFLFGSLPEAQLLQNPVRVALQTSPFWTITFVVLAVIGVVAQLQSTRRTKVATYNRLAEPSDPAA